MSAIALPRLIRIGANAIEETAAALALLGWSRPVTAWSIKGTMRYADCARTVGVASDADSDTVAADRLVSALQKINKILEVPSRRSYGLPEAKWTNLIPLMSEQALASGSPANNPRVPNASAIQDLCRQVWA